MLSIYSGRQNICGGGRVRFLDFAGLKDFHNQHVDVFVKRTTCLVALESDT